MIFLTGLLLFFGFGFLALAWGEALESEHLSILALFVFLMLLGLILLIIGIIGLLHYRYLKNTVADLYGEPLRGWGGVD
jgi:hypothetical protein